MSEVRPPGDAAPETPAPAGAARARGQIAIALTVALLGFLLATQLRAQQGLAQRLQIERESDLGQILTELQQRSDQLQDQIIDLRLQLERASSSATQERTLAQDARKQLEALRILLGVVAVEGPGITITVGDPRGTVGPDVLLDAIQELRDAGAESIDIDDVRVVARTAIGGRAGALTAGGTRLRAPYVVRAIGDPATLAEAMRIPGGVVDALGAREGASARIARASRVRITSTSPAPRSAYARPRR
jgi:uncharacterized protein YlxW (UPF0749 family)